MGGVSPHPTQNHCPKLLQSIALPVQALERCHAIRCRTPVAGDTFVTVNFRANGTLHALLGGAPQEVVALATPSSMMERLLF